MIRKNFKVERNGQTVYLIRDHCVIISSGAMDDVKLCDIGIERALKGTPESDN